VANPPVPEPKKDLPIDTNYIKILLSKKSRTEQEDEILKLLVGKLAEENPQVLAELIHRWLSEK